MKYMQHKFSETRGLYFDICIHCNKVYYQIAREYYISFRSNRKYNISDEEAIKYVRCISENE